MSELEPASNIIKLDPAAIQKVEWIEQRDKLIAGLKAVKKVADDDGFKIAGQMQTVASKHLKELEKERQRIKRPALDYGRDIDAQAKELRAVLEGEIARVKKMNGDYATKKAKEAEAERRRIAEAEAAKAQNETVAVFGGLEVEVASGPVDFGMSEMLPTGKVNTGANVQVTTWEFEIVNQKLVPAEFLSVDERKVREFMKYKTKMGETPEVPGIRFSSRVDVRSK